MKRTLRANSVNELLDAMARNEGFVGRRVFDESAFDFQNHVRNKYGKISVDYERNKWVVERTRGGIG